MSDLGKAAARWFAGSDHDHEMCVARALGQAEAVCARRGARLTPLRRRVLELVWQGHAPVGAYELLRRLGQERGGAVPPTVYRALDFLVEHGLVHRIESLNAFVGCAAPVEDHTGQFLICRRCGSAAEIHEPGVDRAIQRGAAKLGFTAERHTIEVAGLCATCRQGAEHDG